MVLTLTSNMTMEESSKSGTSDENDHDNGAEATKTK
jgi:hypothetical protein